MAGCGSKKKMAKGGMVSPRKAMAMGKKPKKFAAGGMVAGSRTRPNTNPLIGVNVDPVRPRPIRTTGAGTVATVGPNAPKGPRTAPVPMGGPKRYAKGGSVKKGKK